jgi:preprotein translocase subunit YajC
VGRKSKISLFVILAISLLGTLFAAGCALPVTTSSSNSTTTTTGGFDWTLIIFIVVIFALMYFLMIRPQRKRQKEQQKMMSELQRGDDVVTVGGIYGKIESVDENSIVIKLEDGAKMRIVKGAIGTKRSPESIL